MLTNKNNTFFTIYIPIMYLLLFLVYLLGMLMPLMELDSAQHATMAMRMYTENDFWNIIKLHQPYLDKPHMHFWLSALSFKLFGISEFAYRLPAVLFLWAGAYATFRLGKLLYEKTVGHIGALIFLSSQTIILSAHDVRTDAVLTGATILAIWKITAYLKNSKWTDVVLGAVFMGIAFSTKGLIAVVVVGLSIFSYLLYERNWKRFFRYKTLLGLVAFILSITPVLYAYYQQYDLHPELIVEGTKNVSGVRFILWDQVFNRMNAKGFGETSPDYFFFFHTLLWAFLPFVLIGYTALYNKGVFFFKKKFSKIKGVEFLTFGGVVLTLLLISFSKFKLPHYLNILIPVFSITTASYLAAVNHQKKVLKSLIIAQYVVVGVTIMAGVLLGFYVFGKPPFAISLISVLGLLCLLWLCFVKQNLLHKIVIISVVASVWVNFNLNATFYPRLLKNYQGGMQLAKVVKEKNIDTKKVFFVQNDYHWSFDFYTKQNTRHLTIKQLKNRTTPTWIVVSEKRIQEVRNAGIPFKKVAEVKRYHVTRLTPKFLNPNTRNQVIDRMYLLQI